MQTNKSTLKSINVTITAPVTFRKYLPMKLKKLFLYSNVIHAVFYDILKAQITFCEYLSQECLYQPVKLGPVKAPSPLANMM